MDSLPNEIIAHIFFDIEKITDKRQFIKTCLLFNGLLNKFILELSNKFIEKFKHDNSRTFWNYMINEHVCTYCVEKFSMELCCDGSKNEYKLIYFIHILLFQDN
jgi:hypothetical protein